MPIPAVLFLQRLVMYQPRRSLPSPDESGVPFLSRLHVRTEDGLELEGWGCPPPRAGAPTVLFFHGNDGNIHGRRHKAEILHAGGFGVVMAEYRGYGHNLGWPTERGLYCDARAFADAVRGPLIVMGESLGSGVAVQLATERPVAAVVLEAPFRSVASVTQGRFPTLPVAWMIADRYDNEAKLPRLEAPVLVVHGKRDVEVPIAHGRRLVELARRGTLLELDEAGHRDLWRHGAGEEIVAWLRRTLAAPPARLTAPAPAPASAPASAKEPAGTVDA